MLVQGTAYATPTGAAAWRPFPDAVLFPGESTHLDVEFVALRNMGGFADIFLAENVARVLVQADLDQDRFFVIRNQQNVFEEITPT